MQTAGFRRRIKTYLAKMKRPAQPALSLRILHPQISHHYSG